MLQPSLKTHPLETFKPDCWEKGNETLFFLEKRIQISEGGRRVMSTDSQNSPLSKNEGGQRKRQMHFS